MQFLIPKLQEGLLKADTLSKTALVMSLALSLHGCFKYIPTELEATPPGEEVRIMVTPEGVLELSEVTGVDLSNPVVRGEILGREANDILLSVPVGQRQEGFHRMQLNQTIRVPAAEIIRVDLREFNSIRTGLLIGGGLGASVFLVKAIIQAFGEVGLDNPVDPPELRLNLFSIPISE